MTKPQPDVFIPFSERPESLPLRDPKTLTREQFDQRFSHERLIAFGQFLVGLVLEEQTEQPDETQGS